MPSLLGYLQNFLVSELLTSQLRIPRVIPYGHKRVTLGERRSFMRNILRLQKYSRLTVSE